MLKKCNSRPSVYNNHYLAIAYNGGVTMSNIQDTNIRHPDPKRQIIDPMSEHLD